jgi:glucose/arabinose dehydrogenase
MNIHGRNRNSGEAATEVKSFAPSLKFTNPNGVCWTKDGFLIVAEHNRILNFPAAEFFYEGPDVAVIEVVGQGKLIPVEEESYNHGARVCKIGKDGMLYVSLGQPHNVQPRDKIKLYNDVGIGGMVRMNAFDGSKREVYATGIRNSVGHDFNPKNNDLWFTDNQTDGMGDDIPAGEINRITKAGQFFGYPWIQGKTRITEHGYDKDPLPANVTNPEVIWTRMLLTWAWLSIRARSFQPNTKGASSRRNMVHGTAPTPSARASCSPV